ncbi:GntR family transcriptional regulator [Agromyces bracchium]|uniref:GntR family transcriptional regulator n=1 Tax=Agromyces bracchium TaxID=88376 RepID=A0A6I3M829_9MICO|nr:GntR family transcriptional regulator [Agromyces bracchium]MTH69385.1 GntR family transcriptional regulator [Agromyces bracchium]
MTTMDTFLRERLLVAPGTAIRVAVYSRLADGIRTGVLPLGALLPRETELAAQLRVSRTPVREALILLEEDGLIRTKRGVGRFVADALPRSGLEVFRPFDDLLAESGGDVETEQLRFDIKPTTDFISNKLTLDSAANTWFRECIIHLNGDPVALIHEHLPAGKYLDDVHPEIGEVLLELSRERRSLLAGLIERLGPVFHSGSCQITASLAGESRATLLGIDDADPVLVLTQTAEYRDRPVYLAKCIVSGQVNHLMIVQSSALPS